MSVYYSLPLIILNLGGEMFYVLDQRLEAQNVPIAKGRKSMVYRTHSQVLFWYDDKKLLTMLSFTFLFSIGRDSGYIIQRNFYRQNFQTSTAVPQTRIVPFI